MPWNGRRERYAPTTVPEQSEGGTIDGRADVYALGVIFYEMLTGEKPYKSESVVDIIVQHKQAPIPKLPEAHEWD